MNRQPYKSFLVLLILALIGTSFSFTNDPNNISKKIRKELGFMSYIPTGVYRIDNEKVRIKEFYIFSNEVTNEQYAEFIEALKANGELDKLSEAQIDSELWNVIDASGIESYVESYKDKPNYPVVNISKKAALLYCEWLTESWKGRFDGYNVSFRLPTEMEWEYAASGGLDLVKYSWGGPYTYNGKGCFLAQHKAIGLKFGPEKTGKYFANGYGLYDMCGNAAEMLADKDYTKGGNWNGPKEQLEIRANETLAKSPFVGFRPVMILEKI